MFSMDFRSISNDSTTPLTSMDLHGLRISIDGVALNFSIDFHASPLKKCHKALQKLSMTPFDRKLNCLSFEGAAV